MNMQHRLRSQSLPSLAPLHMSVTLKLRLKRLDMRWRKLAHWYLPKPCRDLALDKLAMAHRSLACNPPLNDLLMRVIRSMQFLMTSQSPNWQRML
jgi:hypothetical protein